MMHAITSKVKQTSHAPSHTTEVSVRFHEVDSYHIVWHGHYVSYLEVGREAFGQHYKLSYQHLLEKGLRAPIIHINVDYRRSLCYGDRVRILTEYVEVPQAKICFKYTLTSPDGATVYCRAATEQVLQDADSGRTLPRLPEWHAAWLAQAKEQV